MCSRLSSVEDETRACVDCAQLLFYEVCSAKKRSTTSKVIKAGYKDGSCIYTNCIHSPQQATISQYYYFMDNQSEMVDTLSQVQPNPGHGGHLLQLSACMTAIRHRPRLTRRVAIPTSRRREKETMTTPSCCSTFIIPSC